MQGRSKDLPKRRGSTVFATWGVEIVKRSEQHPWEDCSKLQKEQYGDWTFRDKTISALKGSQRETNLFFMKEKNCWVSYF